MFDRMHARSLVSAPCIAPMNLLECCFCLSHTTKPHTCQRLSVDARAPLSLSLFLTLSHSLSRRDGGVCTLCGERGGIDQEASPHWLRKAARNDNHSRSFGERSSGSSRRFATTLTLANPLLSPLSPPTKQVPEVIGAVHVRDRPRRPAPYREARSAQKRQPRRGRKMR